MLLVNTYVYVNKVGSTIKPLFKYKDLIYYVSKLRNKSLIEFHTDKDNTTKRAKNRKWFQTNYSKLTRVIK